MGKICYNIIGDDMHTREEKMKDIREVIETEEERKARKRFAIRIFKIIVFAFSFVVLFFLYTYFYSTKGLVIKEEKIVNEKIPVSFRGIKIIQFSDLHYGSTYYNNELKNVINKINKRRPDIVIFTGDLINKDYNLKDSDKEAIIASLSNIDATLGKYAIFGEEDNDYTNSILLQSGFKVLNNSKDDVYTTTNEYISLIGLSIDYNITQAFTNFDSSKYNICIFHEPDIITEILKDKTCDLALAGHSHNGQINVPFPIIRKHKGTKYYKEYYKIKDTDLYVSSGLGTSNINVRVGSHPSINFFRLYNN